jgi:hypothetical protein
MQVTDILERIEGRLAAVGLSAAEASMRVAGHKDLLRNFRRSIERGSDTGLSIPSAVDLAKILGVSVQWLLTGEDSDGSSEPATTHGLIYAPLISWVSAGRLDQPDHVEDLASAKLVGFPDLERSGRWIALRVDGDSMDRISPPDSIIAVDLSDRRLIPNGCYVFGDGEGGATYKRWRPADHKNRYPQIAPVSTNKRHEPIFLYNGQEPIVIGRVRRSMLEM